MIKLKIIQVPEATKAKIQKATTLAKTTKYISKA
jgi:hypothetical protein